MFDKSFRRNLRDVSAEMIDGEAIIINVATGVYYSLENVGASIWGLLTAGHSVEQSVTVLGERYDVAEDRLRADLARFVEQLLDEDLLVEAEAAPVNGATAGEPTLVADAGSYETPHLNIYRDMGDLLALDPPTPGLSLTPWDSTESPKLKEA